LPASLLQLLIIGLTNGAVIGLNAIAVTLIYGTVRTINLAHGDIFALLTVLVATVVTGLGLNALLPATTVIGGIFLALLIAVVVGALLSGLVERIAFKPFRDRNQTTPLGPLLATLGISFMLYQVALLWRTWLPSWLPGEHRSVPGVPELPRQSISELVPDINFIQALGLSPQLDVIFTLKDLLLLLIALACAFGMTAVIQRTRLGKAVRAVSQDSQLAQLVGVHADRTFLQVFMLGGAMAGVAAFIFTAYYTRPFGNHGAQSGLIALAAAILGGVGNPIGALVAGLCIGVASAYSDFFLKAQWTPVLVQVLLIALLIARPRGFGGEEAAEEANSVSMRLNLSSLLPGHISQRARIAILALLAVALVYPPLTRALVGFRQETMLTAIMTLVIMALGLNILLGFAGVLDLGFAVSFGLGAYTAAFLTNSYGGFAAALKLPPNQPINFLIVLAASAAVAGLFGVLNGLLTLRVKADYLAIVTLAFGQMAVLIINNLGVFTGGFGGISALPPPRLFGFDFETPLSQYYLALALVTVLAVGSQRVIRSRMGRAMTAMGIDEVAAASNGVNPAETRIRAFAISTAFAGMAGALFANTATFVSPDLTDFPLSSQALAMVIVGGAGSVPGTIFGAFIVAGYDRIAIPALTGALGWLSDATGFNLALDVRNLNYLSFGLALYLTVLLRARAAPNQVRESK
jgi:branched-chain amino acid transport system permease protein